MENINIKIRRATISDTKAISNVLKMAFSDYYNILGVKIPTVSESMDDIADDINNKNVYVAIANNMLVIGSIRFHMIGDICYISRFGILPKWQSTGCGKLLLSEVDGYCKQNEVCAMALHTATKLKKQIMYYYSQSFYIHSTSVANGYVRGLLIKEMLCTPSAESIANL